MKEKSKIDKLCALIQKDLKGAALVKDISEVKSPFLKKRSTGILSLDLALNGGFPAGTMNQIFGPDGVGKDYLANLIIAENQRAYGEVAATFWMSFGYRPDNAFMRDMCGVQVAKSDEELIELGIDPEKATAEERGVTMGDLKYVDLEALIKEAIEKPSEVLLSAVIKMIESNLFQIGIVNELGSGETKDNVKKTLGEDAKRATFATLMSDFCRKYYTALRLCDNEGNPNETTMFMINPVRANMDPYSARFQKYVQGSGHALRHAKAVDLHLDNAGKIVKLINGKKITVGKSIKWFIAKGKHGISEGAEGKYDFYFHKGVDLAKDVALTALAYDVVSKTGNSYKILDYEDKIIGVDRMINHVREDEALQKELKKAVLDAARNGHRIANFAGEEAQEDDNGESEE